MIFLSPGAQEAIHVAHVCILCILSVLNIISLVCLIYETPAHHWQIRRYLLLTQVGRDHFFSVNNGLCIGPGAIGLRADALERKGDAIEVMVIVNMVYLDVLFEPIPLFPALSRPVCARECCAPPGFLRTQCSWASSYADEQGSHSIIPAVEFVGLLSLVVMACVRARA